MPEEYRIKPEDFVNAYKETGIQPILDNYGYEREGVRYGCALTALVSKKKKCFTVPENIVYISNALNLNSNYIIGFMHGFKGDHVFDFEGSLLLKGYEDGAKAYKTIKDLIQRVPKMITAEKALKAYEETGITPIAQEFGLEEDGVCYGCVVTALLSQKKGCFTVIDDLEVIAKELDMDVEYVTAFTEGFDGYSIQPHFPDNARLGREDGHKVYSAIKEAFGDSKYLNRGGLT